MRACLPLLLLLAAPALAQDDPWPAAAPSAAAVNPAEDAPGAPARVAPTAAAPAAAQAPATAATAASVAPAVAPPDAPLFLADLDGAARYLLVLLVLLLAYVGPALLYPTVLSATTLGPGKAAALCLAAGALLAFPGVLLVLGRAQFQAGVPVAWFKQTAHYGVAGGVSAVLLALAALASRAKGSTP